MNLKALLGVAPLLALASAQAQAVPPAIRAIRENYDAVNAQIAAGELIKTVEEAHVCSDFYGRWTRWKTPQGQLKRYQHASISSTDKANYGFTVDYWFDKNGRRDFVLAVHKTTPADPKEDFELRVYYNDAGTVIHTTSKPQQRPEVVRELLVSLDTIWQTRTRPINCPRE